MASAYLIAAERDREFIRQHVLPVLPSNGYGFWLSRLHLGKAGGFEEPAVRRAIDQCEVVLAIASSALLDTHGAEQEIEIASRSRRPLITVQPAKLEERLASRFPASLWAAPRVDFELEGEKEARGLLIDLVPPIPQETADTPMPDGAERIEWNEEIFSAALREAARRHDHARAESLVAVMLAHLAHRRDAYPPQHACKDLQELREEREFALMKRYAQAVMASGTGKDTIRRLYAQALIETKEYASALQVLQSIVDDKESSRKEIFEAYGLIGRTYKQRFAEAPQASDSRELLGRAIEAYSGVFEKDRGQFWHAVNAASCLNRAERDGILDGASGRAQEIARHVVKSLDGAASKGPLDVWDCASRTEALLALERYDDAESALDTYLNHKDMRAFEAFSTFRQFDQILDLGKTDRGRPLWERLRDTVERYRAGALAPQVPATQRGVAETQADASFAARSLVIRVGDPAWNRDDISDLVIQSRLGKIVTASGSDASVRELLRDSGVISVEQSRPAGAMECERSLPFIRIAPEYAGAAGNYKETGDHALIAVIDEGIDVLHGAFVDAHGKSRIVGIWDQTDASGAPPPGCAYGTFHDAAAIDNYLSTSRVPAHLGRNDNGHGTHVASIAAGRATNVFAGGVAPDAKLLIVVSAARGPVGYSATHIDALSFIDSFAAALSLPVVVNLSQGMNAGAHDGKSSLEVAFDAFSESGRKRGRVVVKSAGNERAKGGHAYVTVPPQGLEQLKWNRPEGADYTERLELWWSSADEMEFRLLDRFGDASRWIGTAAPEDRGTFAMSGPYHMAFTKRHVDNGDSLLVIELGDAGARAGLGEWTLEIVSRAAPEGGHIHAWIERTAGKPSSFVTHAHEEVTLSIPGTAASVIAVGAVDASMPIRVGVFSSYGPTRDGQNKPLVCAPGVDVRAADGGTDAGVREESGTSMAAPHVAGAIALLLSRTAKQGTLLSANQIAGALRQKTQHYNGRWDRGQGYGVIDVGALLGAF